MTRHNIAHQSAITDKVERPFAAELLQVPFGVRLLARQLLTLSKATDAADLPEQAIIDILSMLLGAGADTISAFMQHFLKTAAANPKAVDKARAGKSSGPVLAISLSHRQRDTLHQSAYSNLVV